jgi:hypothetical protein
MTPPEFRGHRLQRMFGQQGVRIQEKQNLSGSFASAEISCGAEAAIAQFKNAAARFARQVSGPIMATIRHHDDFKILVTLRL